MVTASGATRRRDRANGFDASRAGRLRRATISNAIAEHTSTIAYVATAHITECVRERVTKPSASTNSRELTSFQMSGPTLPRPRAATHTDWWTMVASIEIAASPATTHDGSATAARYINAITTHAGMPKASRAVITRPT